MTTRTVTTMEELKKAKGENVEKIIVEGKLAENLAKSKKLTTLSPTTIAVLTVTIAAATAGVAAAPATGGISTIAVPISFVAATPTVSSLGLSTATIKFLVTAGIGGLTIILGTLNGYTMEVDIKNLRVNLFKK